MNLPVSPQNTPTTQAIEIAIRLAVTLIAVVSIAAILMPVISLSTSVVESAITIGNQISTGKANISPPSESVREWPLIGAAFLLGGEALLALSTSTIRSVTVGVKSTGKQPC
ncbi:MAG: hypothetical protein BMS9Abin30_0612 [Gammaproteobacteria bacterium]|nr:MAG: hypothetical protein BMS9Abin30_0612 [Gammaproteobacteria bacterium]